MSAHSPGCSTTSNTVHDAQRDSLEGLHTWQTCMWMENGATRWPEVTGKSAVPLTARSRRPCPRGRVPTPRPRSPRPAGPSTKDPGRTPRAGTRCAAAAHRRPHRARRQGIRPRRIAGHRQAAGGERVRHRRRCLLLPLLRRDRGHRCRPGDRHRPRRRRQPRRLRAGRRVRAHHPLELPAAPGVVEGRARPARGQHDRPQAQRAHPLHLDPADAGP